MIYSKHERLLLGMISLFVSISAWAMTGAEVVQALSELREGNRTNAIASLIKNGQLQSPLAAAEAARILTGTTHGARASAISELAGVLKEDLNGQHAALVLGSPSDLADGNRANAISALARAKRFGPSIGGDGGLALNGATHGARATAISEMAPYFRTDMRGQDIAAILGSAQLLTDGNRANAIVALARAGRLPRAMTGAEGEMILAGATHGARATAISEMAPWFKNDLTGQEAALMLGLPAELVDGNRANAISALARAKRFGPSIGGDGGLALNGATHGARATAISEMAPYFRTDMRGQDIAAILGSAQLLTDGNRANAIVALARAGRLPRAMTGAEGEMILAGATHGARATAISEMAPWFKNDLTGNEAAMVLGRNGETTEGNRYNAIAALARAGKIRGSLSGEQLSSILEGTTGQTRSAATAVLEYAVSSQASTMTSGGATPLPIGGTPFPSTTVGTTPTSIPPICSQPIETEFKFCELLRAVTAELVKDGLEATKGWAYHRAFEKVFKALPLKFQLSLFSRGFLKREFATVSLKRAASSFINSPSAASLFLVDLFASAMLEAYGDWARATYQNTPWVYALVQGYGDQMYVGLMATLTTSATGQPAAGWMEALFLESEITVTRIGTVGQYAFALVKERKAAIASMAQLIISGTSASFARQQGFQATGSRIFASSEDAVAAFVRQAVTSTDIPEFDRVAHIVYQARMSKLAASVQSTTLFRTQSLVALALASELDSRRPTDVRMSVITAFGSYKQATETLLDMLGLPLK